MKRIHLVGQKNSGKTTLTVELIEWFTARGLRVGTVKHTRHHHELDVLGKDSQRHRAAGGNPAAIISGELTAVFFRPEEEDRYAALAPLYAGCDFVLVEGDRATTAPKIEVWRSAITRPPYAEQDDSILAIITDDPLPCPTSKPIWPRRDLGSIAERVLGLLDIPH